ncbi:thioredoxin domain-containing protein [Nonomuraea sp. NPDC049400]|uniref:thioredoxin domain-containing protein n=1 Tax=Nonomuraea sp. NPDC049400 TaxID=3364352 RepID=UPI0037A2BDEE
MPTHAPGSVDSVTEQAFAESVIQGKRPVQSRLWAAWCGPCPTLIPRDGSVDR